MADWGGEGCVEVGVVSPPTMGSEGESTVFNVLKTQWFACRLCTCGSVWYVGHAVQPQRMKVGISCVHFDDRNEDLSSMWIVALM